MVTRRQTLIGAVAAATGITLVTTMEGTPAMANTAEQGFVLFHTTVTPSQFGVAIFDQPNDSMLNSMLGRSHTFDPPGFGKTATGQLVECAIAVDGLSAVLTIRVPKTGLLPQNQVYTQI